jgi:Bacteriophage HK97-gp10, putative tail-component
MRFVINPVAVEHLLRDPDGMVARDLQRRALNVESQAKLNASGIPVEGANNPEGRGPNVDTGRLRSSITHELAQREDGTLVARIGTNVEYGLHLETGLRNGATYPFLRPALVAARI